MTSASNPVISVLGTRNTGYLLLTSQLGRLPGDGDPRDRAKNIRDAGFRHKLPFLLHIAINVVKDTNQSSRFLRYGEIGTKLNLSSKSKTIGALLTAVVAAGFVGIGASQATTARATPTQDSVAISVRAPVSASTTLQVEKARKGLNRSAVVTHTAIAGPGIPDVYKSADGNSIILVQPVPAKLSVGSTRLGSYIAYNHTDQLAIKNAGTAAITAAICLASVAVCIIAGIVAAGAGTYVSANGFCPGNEVLRTYFEQGIDGNATITAYRCVKSYAGA